MNLQKRQFIGSIFPGLLAAAPLGLFGQIPYNETTTFDSPVPLSDTEADDVWFVDRYAPAAFESFDFSGENVLKVSIDGVGDGAANRGSQSGTFYNTHGRKLNLPDGTYAVAADLYYPASWEGASTRRRSDLWGTAVDGSGSITAYPIAGIANTDGTPVIRYYNVLTGEWVNTAITPVPGTWYRFEHSIEGDELVVTVNGLEAGRQPSNGTKALRDVIIQAYNFNDPALDPGFQSTDSYDVFWDNFSVAFPLVTNITQATIYDSLPAAVAAANPGDELSLAGGTYVLPSTLNINKPLTITGTSEEHVIIDASSLGASWGIHINADDVTLSNFTVIPARVGEVASGSAGGFAIHGNFDTSGPSNEPYENLSLSDITIADGNRTSFDIHGFDGVSLKNLTASGNRYGNGIQVTGCTDVSFTGCTTFDNAWGGIAVYSSQAVYLGRGSSNVTFDFNANSVAEFFYSQNDYGYTNSGITVLNATHEIANDYAPGVGSYEIFDNEGEAAAADLALAWEARFTNGKTLLNEVATGDFLVPAGLSIQFAIDAALAGDTVRLLAGNHAASLSVAKELTIEGPNAGIPAGSNPGARVAEAVLDGGFIASASGIVIDGLTIQNGRPSGSVNVGVAVAADNVTVANTIIENVPGSQSDGLSTQPGIDNLALTASTIRNNWRGIYLNPGDGNTLTGNLIDANNGVGVGIGSDGQSNLTLSDNVISNHTLEGWGASAVGVSVVAQQNNFLNNGVSVAHYGGAAIDATYCHWGSSAEPDDQVSGLVDYSPWYADAARTIEVTAANFEDQTVPGGTTQTEDNLLIGSGSTYTVEDGGALILTGDFTLEDGATLIVEGGDLTLEDGSTFSGSFTFFNSLGSININANTTITASSTGLILISDVHVADGVTITTSGNLVIDGSFLDAPTNFNLVADTGGQLTIARSVVENATITLDTGDVKIYDNSFLTSTITVSTGVNDAEVYHNLTDNAGFLTDNGTGTITTVDGWGNITDIADTENNLLISLNLGSLSGGQTIDAEGNIFVQPGDIFGSELSVTELQESITFVESLFGYDNGLVTLSGSPAPGPNWEDVIVQQQDTGSVIGKLDSAIGFTFDSGGGPSTGSADDQLIMSVDFEADVEGQTFVFHRVKLATDTFPGDLRLTTGTIPAAYLTPFTSNSSMVTIDGTDPLIADTALYASVEQDGADMLVPGVITIQGDLDITATAYDALAGIEDASAVITLVETTSGTTYTATQNSTSTVDVSGVDYTGYDFTFPVDSTTENGVYNVIFTVTDRSGNGTATIIGQVEINKNQIILDIELEGLVAGPLTRDVVLVTTDGGGAVIETRTETITFTSGVGQVTLTDILGTPAGISAKTAWNLRKRSAFALDIDGQATIDLTGANALPGGDLNGDNIVNALDYSTLRYYYNSLDGAAVAADINGDGFITLPDYNILRANFYTAGDSL